MYVFVYGTLMSDMPNNGVMKMAEFVCEALVKGELYTLGDYPVIDIDGVGGVTGEIYKLFDERSISVLDHIEGFGEKNHSDNYYDREIVGATGSNFKTYDVEIYHMTKENIDKNDGEKLSKNNWKLNLTLEG